MVTTSVPSVGHLSCLKQYLEEMQQFPILEPQEEYMLSQRWRNHSDLKAAHRLITSHLRLVVKVAMQYRGYGFPINEVVSEGNIGLMQAVKRFDPDKGFRLATYAVWWIKAAIHEYVLRSWSLVKLGTTASQKKLFFNLRKIKWKISALNEGDIHPEHVEHIATALGVDANEVITMNRRLAGDKSLNAPVRNDFEDSGELQDLLVDETINPEQQIVEDEKWSIWRTMLSTALADLSERERRIFKARRIDEPPLTLAQLGAECNVSRERIRQIESSVLDKIKKNIIKYRAEKIAAN